jgi:hypothetical protein
MFFGEKTEKKKILGNKISRAIAVPVIEKPITTPAQSRF